MKVRSNSSTGLTVIADLSAIDVRIKTESQTVYHNTWTKAQLYNLQMEKVVGAGWLPCKSQYRPRVGFADRTYASTHNDRDLLWPVSGILIRVLDVN